MRKTAADLLLKTMGARYDYDVSYMRAMLQHSPKAFFKFVKIMDVARHREAAATEAIYAAKLVGALAEDCGPCTQLVVNMAREAHVPDDQIEATLRRDAQAMSADTALGFRFAEAIAYRLANEDEAREAVRARWGEKGVIDLTLALQIGRIFPMVKAGLGYAKECRRVAVNGRSVDVVKRAA
jgi:integrase